MIRTILIATSFIAITAALVVLQPGGAKRDRDGADVTRAGVDLTSLASRPAAPAPQMAAADPSAAQALAAAVAVAKAAPPKPTIQTDNTSLRDMTDGVLTDLGLKPATTPEGEAMRNETASALANISALRPGTAAKPEPHKLQTIIVQALREGQSDAYIDALLNEAAGKGEVTVPKALVTSDGRVDTATLLANIVASATAASTGAAVKASSDRAVGGDGVEVRMVTKADGETVQYKFYTVNKGDSLGAIAVKFYGDVTYFSAIFDANRGILSSPDRIRAGQRLVIPNLRQQT